MSHTRNIDAKVPSFGTPADLQDGTNRPPDHAPQYHDIGIGNEFGYAAACTAGEGLKLRTQRGRIRYTAAAMARLLLLDGAFGRRTDPKAYSQGFALKQREGEFISSIESVARSVYARTHFCYSALPTAPPHARRCLDTGIGNEFDSAPSFEAFYRSLAMDLTSRRGISTRAEGAEPCPDPLAEVYVCGEDGEFYGAPHFWDLGQAATKDDLREMGEQRGVKNRDFYGKRLSVRGTVGGREGIGTPDLDPAQRMVQATYEPKRKDRFVPDRATSYLTTETVQAHALHREFRAAQTWGGKGAPYRTVEDALAWQQRAQRGGEALKPKLYHSQFTDEPSVLYHGRERHVSIGSFLASEVDAAPASDLKENRSCTMPYIVLDIDVDAEQYDYPTCYAKDLTDALLTRMEQLGADLSDVVVSHTGKTGFHIRIPAGMVGNPIFRTARDAKEICTRFAKKLFTNVLEGQALAAIDRAKFSPNSMITAIGSRRSNGRYAVGYAGGEFRETHPMQIEAYSEQYSPFRMDDPQDAPACRRIAAALDRACQEWEDARAAQSAAQGFQESRGIIQRIERGVSKGENFAESYEGRNVAANLLSLRYVQRYGEREAWERVQEWNREKCAPPLGEDPSDDAGELRRAFDSAARYARKQMEKQPA